MLSGEFQRKLRRLNPKLRIFCGDSDRPASLYQVVNNKEETICGIDKNWIPRRISYDEQGHIIKSGYERVLKILIFKRLVSKQWAEKVFEIHLGSVPVPVIKEKYNKDISQYHKDDLAEIGSKSNV